MVLEFGPSGLSDWNGVGGRGDGDEESGSEARGEMRLFPFGG